MEVIISIALLAVVMGVPTWLVIRALKKVENNEVAFSPEEVTQRLKNGFFLSKWGMELAFGSIATFALLFCDIPETIQFVVPMGSLIVGMILLFVGRVKIGITTRYLNYSTRSITELERFVLDTMIGIENEGMRLNGMRAITKLTPGITDDMLVTLDGMGTISRFSEIGRLYTGKNVLKNHWPIISIAIIIFTSVLLTVCK